jgi:hypothetical protein
VDRQRSLNDQCFWEILIAGDTCNQFDWQTASMIQAASNQETCKPDFGCLITVLVDWP